MGPHDHCLHSDPLVLSALGVSTEDQYSVTRVYGCVRCVHSGPLHYRSWVWILLGTGGVEVSDAGSVLLEAGQCGAGLGTGNCGLCRLSRDLTAPWSETWMGPVQKCLP